MLSKYIYVYTFVIVVGCLISPQQSVAQLIINEISASNASTLFDEDGDAPDWIELYNSSSAAVSLADYYISDDNDEPFKFRLPEITLGAGNYMLLFASDKNREGGEFYWNTVIRSGDGTKYFIPTTSVSDSWINHEFDDSAWQTGTFGIGYGDNDDSTQVPSGTISIFTRSTFQIEDISNLERMMLHIDFDDAYIAYINGVEVSRENISGDAPVPFNQQADNYTEPKLAFGTPLPALDLGEHIHLLNEGENTLAIQLHNFNASSSDLTLIPFLSLGYSSDPMNTIGVAEETGLIESEIYYPHANFKLSSDGETVYLHNSIPFLIDSLKYPELRADESFGRYSGDNELYIFTITTPGRANNIEGYTTRSSTPILSQSGGFFENDVRISLQDPSLGDITYFTTDGSIPTTTDVVFGSGNQLINSTRTIKLRTFEPGGIPSEVIVETYFIDENHDLPVVTVSTHPDNLWSDESGIYVIGTNGIPAWGVYENGGANWNQDWEIPIHFELFEKDGSKAFGVGAGAKIAGAWSRSNPAKSLKIYFRSEYGTRALDYKMFNSKEIYSFQSIALRNSGNDFSSQGHSMFRDGLMTTLVNDTENDIQAFRPAVLYLNGEYWGIHNIREKINEHFVESNSSASSDNIDLLQGGGEMDFPSSIGAIHGTTENYDEMMSFIVSSDLSDPELFVLVEEMIDMDNYIDYMAAQIYYGNTDWPGNNVKLWRSRTADSKWRWILYDTDFGFALSYGGQYWHNTLSFALEENGPGWPNPPWSTELFRELVESKVFRDKFANRMAGLMNVNYKPSNVYAVIDSLAGLIESEIPRHMSNETRSGYWGGSVNEWNNQISIMKEFAVQRPGYIESFFTQSTGAGGKFATQSLSMLNVNVTNQLHGTVKVNRLKINQFPWQGEYFGGIDIPIIAIPKPGFEFAGWTGDIVSDEIEIVARAGQSLTATFRVASDEANVVINEIMYNASDEYESGDWIELYNAGAASVNLAGWIIKDEDDNHEFVIPEGIVLSADAYLVVAQDLSKFEEIYPQIENVIGSTGFGLSGNSDAVRLYSQNSMLMDSLIYDDESPWPVDADGTGHSLELIDASTDNEIAENWRASSFELGSPGMENGSSVSTSEENESPKEIELLQNYPNPFNPSTTITYSVPTSSQVRLEVYSVSGQRVATLVDEFIQSGKYSTKWDASNQASGVYFYTLTVGKESFSKKMVLIK